MHALFAEWKKFQPEKAPYVLRGDEQILSNPKLFCRFTSWGQFAAAPDFGAPGQSKLHLDLLPMPFVGNLKSASVFLLMLNPGFGPHDYFGEYNVPEYRTALLNNLRQGRDNSFMFLDSRFSWHGGFDYWHTKLQNVIAAFAESTSTSYGRARSFFQSHIAALELVPDHSVNFTVPARLFNSLRSVQLARAFVHDELLPRAKSRDRLLVVTRAVKHWRLRVSRNIVAYGPTEARSAHLSVKSRGGSAILKFLCREYAKRAA
ncbi:MAG: hypothetical protein AB1555_16660 [Nitrospirota bacterium]